MKILGIDPGTARVGWGIVSDHQSSVRSIAYGCIETSASESDEERLRLIHSDLVTIIEKHTPDCMCVEKLFFSKNVTTAMTVGQARGVVLLAAAQHDLPVISYSPPVIKKSITGTGRANKQQMQRMVTKLLSLTHIPTPDDTADALAVALTHAFSYKLKHKLT